MNDYYTHFALKQYFIFYILTDQVQRKTLREIHIRTLSSFRLGGVEWRWWKVTDSDTSVSVQL